MMQHLPVERNQVFNAVMNKKTAYFGDYSNMPFISLLG